MIEHFVLIMHYNFFLLLIIYRMIISRRKCRFREFVLVFDFSIYCNKAHLDHF